MISVAKLPSAMSADLLTAIYDRLEAEHGVELKALAERLSKTELEAAALYLLDQAGHGVARQLRLAKEIL